MEISLTQEMIELHQSFILLNYKLYKFKYGDTVEGKRRLELYYRILKTIHELASKKIANLDSLQANLGLVFPMLPIPVLEELADNLKNLTSGVLDVTIYTNILFYMATISTCLNQQMIGIMSVFKMRAGKRSRLDDLECKKQVIEIFKKIRELEKNNTSKGRSSAFATMFQQELRPLLKDTDYFKEHLEAGMDYEQAYRVNNRAYKSIKKLYNTWKKNSASKLEKALMIFDNNLWNMSWRAVPKGMDITPKVQSFFIDFAKNIDEIIANEK